MTDIATIKGFNLAFTLAQMGVKNPQQLGEALSFDSITSVMVKDGSYTPSNDYCWLWQNIPASDAPNVIFVQTPTVVSLSVRIASGLLVAQAMPVNKLGLVLLPPGTIVDSIYLEGRVGSGALQSGQGVPASYYCLMAQANF